MIYQNFFNTPQALINALGNYSPYIIKVKCKNRDESDWLQNKPYYSVSLDKFFCVGKQKFPIKYIERISIKTKDETKGKNQYDFFVSNQYFAKNNEM